MSKVGITTPDQRPWQVSGEPSAGPAQDRGYDGVARMSVSLDNAGPEVAARDVVSAAFRASVAIYETMGTPLYAEFSRHAAENPEMLDLAWHGMEGARPTHLFSAVHYLLLSDPSEPLARYFATLTNEPLPPEGAYADLAIFCQQHRDALLKLLHTRSVQTTYAERCRAILAPMGEVARQAGEPLNLVEIGCSAGVLLVCDKFAYRMNDRGIVGHADAPLLLEGEMKGGPELFIPKIGKRIGIDLYTVDAASEEQRRWLLALCFPELRDEQARLAKALDVIAATEIAFYEGDALKHLSRAMAHTSDPLCIMHSACLFYWSSEARLQLENILLDASKTRDFWRISIEPSDTFDEWQKGRPATGVHTSASRKTGEIIISHYCRGEIDRRPVAQVSADYGTIDWCA